LLSLYGESLGMAGRWSTVSRVMVARPAHAQLDCAQRHLAQHGLRCWVQRVLSGLGVGLAAGAPVIKCRYSSK
jgi:hypothetical protein